MKRERKCKAPPLVLLSETGTRMYSGSEGLEWNADKDTRAGDAYDL